LEINHATTPKTPAVARTHSALWNEVSLAPSTGGAFISCSICFVRVHLITAESPESRRLRRGRLIQFPQLTMPLIAALTPREHSVSHTDEIVEAVRFDVPADTVSLRPP